MIDRSGRGPGVPPRVARSAVDAAARAPGRARALSGPERQPSTRSARRARACSPTTRTAGHDVARGKGGTRPNRPRESARAGTRREAVAFLEPEPFARGREPAGRADILETVLGRAWAHRPPPTTRSPRARRRSRCAADLSDGAAVGTGPHRRSPSLAWYAADRGDRGAAQRSRDRDPLQEPTTPESVGLRVGQPRVPPSQRGVITEARDVGHFARSGSRTQLDGDQILHGFATIGVGSRPTHEKTRSRGRGGLMAARDAGLRQRHDDLALCNLCYLDVEQGRFERRRGVHRRRVARQQRRDTPICAMWQMGVQGAAAAAPGRLARGRAATPARCSRRASSPSAGCGRGWCWGCSPRAGTRPRRTPTSTSCGASAGSLDDLGKIAAGRRRARRAGVDPAAARSRGSPTAGRRPACRGPGSSGRSPARSWTWARRLAARRACRTSARWPTAPVAPPQAGPLRARPRALGRAAPPTHLLAALPLLDDLGARAVGCVVPRQAARAGRDTASRGAGRRRRGPTRPGSPSASSTCWPSSWTASPTRRSPRAW